MTTSTGAEKAVGEYSVSVKHVSVKHASVKLLTEIAALMMVSCFSLSAGAAPADSGTPNVVVGTLQNFIQYYNETVADVVAHGGRAVPCSKSVL